jgi:hypothetical protein
VDLKFNRGCPMVLTRWISNFPAATKGPFLSVEGAQTGPKRPLYSIWMKLDLKVKAPFGTQECENIGIGKTKD